MPSNYRFAPEGTMKSSNLHRLRSTVGAIVLTVLISGCALFPPQPKGQIVVQAVSWPLVKKYAERDAGLPGHKVVVQSAENQSVVAEETTDASGILVFDVPAGKYLVLGVGDPPEEVAVESGSTVKLKLIVH
jgi:hypothetical protein